MSMAESIAKHAYEAGPLMPAPFNDAHNLWSRATPGERTKCIADARTLLHIALTGDFP